MTVRHLRMLLNALIGGGVFAAYMTVLVLQLNPAVPLSPGAVGLSCSTSTVM